MHLLRGGAWVPVVFLFGFIFVFLSYPLLMNRVGCGGSEKGDAVRPLSRTENADVCHLRSQGLQPLRVGLEVAGVLGHENDRMLLS